MMGLILAGVGTSTSPGVHDGKKVRANDRRASKPQNLFLMLLPPQVNFSESKDQ
jgi:hypothetical protein